MKIRRLKMQIGIALDYVEITLPCFHCRMIANNQRLIGHEPERRNLAESVVTGVLSMAGLACLGKLSWVVFLVA